MGARVRWEVGEILVTVGVMLEGGGIGKEMEV